MKKLTLLVFAMLAFCFMQNSIAQVPYATYDINSRTITIGYADKLPDGAFDISSKEKDGINLAENKGLSKYYATSFAKTIVIDKSFANFKPTSCEKWFCGCYATSIIGLENINTENVTNMSNMFDGCFYLTSLDLSGFDTKKVTDMSEMFSHCEDLETIFVSDKWDMSNVKYDEVDASEGYDDMFRDDYKLRGGKGTLYDFEKKIYSYKYAVIDGGDKNPGLLTKKGAPKFSGVQPYAVLTNGTLTLYYDDKHNANSIALPQWKSVAKDVKKVVFDKSFAKYKPKTTARWFEDFAFVTEFSGIENLKTDEVKDMTSMFKNCVSLTTVDLSGFDTKNVAYLGELFSGCVNLTTIFASDKWTTKKAEAMNIKEMEIETLDGNGIEKVKVVEPGLSNIFQCCFKLCGSKGTKFVVFGNGEWSEHVAEYKYAKIDGGVSAPGVFTRKGEKPVVLNAIAYNERPYVVFDNGVLTFYFNNQIPQNACIDYSYLTGYTCNPFAHHVTKVVFDKSFEQYWPTSCDYWFSDFINLKEIVNLQYLDTRAVTSMKSMFHTCTSLKTLDLSSFDTRNVREMNYMFSGCYNLTTIYVSDKWTTHSIANYNYASPMFEGCVNLVGGNGTEYERPEEGYRYYTQSCDYARIDGGILGRGYLTKKE